MRKAKMNLKLIISSILICGVASQCSDPTLTNRDKCLELILMYSSLCSAPSANSTSPYPVLNVPTHQTLKAELSFLNLDLRTDYNATSDNSTDGSYAGLFCLLKPKVFFTLPRVYFLNCQNLSIGNNSGISVQWPTSGSNLTVYVFTKGSDSGVYDGCATAPITIDPDQNLIVNISSFQNTSRAATRYQMGVVNISVNTSTAQSNTSVDKSEQHYGSGDGPPPPLIEYQYEFYYDDENRTSFKPRINISNDSTCETNRTFEEGNYTVLVEVIRTVTTFNENATSNSTLYYGENKTSFHVYEPIANTDMTFTRIKSSSNVTVEVKASGSVPINITWFVGNSTANSSVSCNKNSTVLKNKPDSEIFNCTLSKPGTYTFYANFSNIVSNQSKKFTFTIKKPSNNKAVVTTSTTVVVVITLLIIFVVLAIIFVSGYISYQKLKNRSTETANFTFINLQKPSKIQRVKSQLATVKEKVSKKKRNKLGLVQPKEGELSDVESFYGSLTHFQDYDRL